MYICELMCVSAGLSVFADCIAVVLVCLTAQNVLNA